MQQIITPIIIPIHVEPDKCPKCKANENQIVVCGNCGYEYEEEPTTWQEALFFGITIILIAAFAVWLLLTLGAWLLIHPRDGLLHVLEGQWEYLKDLKIL